MTRDHDTLLATTIADHFPGARVSKEPEAEWTTVALGFGDIQIDCWVNAIRDWGNTKVASLFFELSGGSLDDGGVFASISGYAATPEAAIITGACNWACTFGPVLRAGLAAEEQPEIDRFEATIADQPFRVFINGIDRAILFDDSRDVSARISAARTRFAQTHWLARRIIDERGLPPLSTERPTVLGVFLSDAPGKRVLEVKVNGCDLEGLESIFAGVPPEPDGGMTLLRELAVLVPLGPPTR